LLQHKPNITLPEIADSFGKEVSWVRSQMRSMSRYVGIKREGSRKKGVWKIIANDQK
jgi:hypothetical protein